MGFGVHEVVADVILDDFGLEAGHGGAGAGEEVHDPLAAGLGFEGALDGLDLAADAADAGDEFLAVAEGVGHGGNRIGGYPLFFKAIAKVRRGTRVDFAGWLWSVGGAA